MNLPSFAVCHPAQEAREICPSVPLAPESFRTSSSPVKTQLRVSFPNGRPEHSGPLPLLCSIFGENTVILASFSSVLILPTGSRISAEISRAISS